MIIFFVLYMFFSLLTRAFRTAADQKRQLTRARPAPSSRMRGHTGDLSRMEGKRFNEETESFPWQEFLFPDEATFPDDSAVKTDTTVEVEHHAALRKRPEPVDGSTEGTGMVLARPAGLSRSGPLQKRTGRVAHPSLDLENFFKKENIPRVFIATVVLGPPRGKNPFPHTVHRDRPFSR